MNTAAAFADQLVSLELIEGTYGEAERDYRDWFPSEPSATAQSVGVTVLAPRTAWLVDALKRLSEVSTLDGNWDSYGADAPSDNAVAHARSILSVLSHLDYPPSAVDPSAEGGICISFVAGDRYGDIECFNSGEILAVFIKADGDPTVWPLGTDEESVRDAAAVIKSFINR